MGSRARLLKYTYVAFSFIALVAVCHVLSGNASADTHVFTGAGVDALASNDNNWNIAASWGTHTAPDTGDTVIFNATSTNKACTFDIAKAFGPLYINSTYTGTITQTASFGFSYYYQVSGTMTFQTAYTTTFSGSFSWTAGTLNQAGTWVLSGVGASFTGLSAKGTDNMNITGSYTWIGGTQFGGKASLTVWTGASVTINSGAFLWVYGASASTFRNEGTISGLGTLQIDVRLQNVIITKLGVVSCPVNMNGRSDADTSHTITMSNDEIGLTGALTISSNHASYTCTVNMNGKSIAMPSLAVSARGIISSSVSGARIIDSGALTVSANGKLDCTNIRWVTCGTNWDSLAGTYLPGTGQVNMTATGSTKLAAGQYFYDLWACNGGSTRTLLSSVVVQHRKIVDGTLTQGIYSVTINGTSTTPFTGNGTWSGAINITSTGASYTIWTNVAWTGTIQMQKNCTIIYTGGQLVCTQALPSSSQKWYNVTMKAWAGPSNFQWYAGSTNAAANLTFTASGLLASTTYEILLDGTLSSYVTSNGAGVASFYHASWSHHLLLMDQTPTFTSSPVTVDSMLGTYRYDANASEAVTWAITCSDPDIDIDANGVVSGYLSTDSAITISIRATDASGGVAYQNYTITVHGPMTDLAPMMVGIIPVIALIVIFGIGMNSIKRKRG